jgi:hypothetical protein
MYRITNLIINTLISSEIIKIIIYMPSTQCGGAHDSRFYWCCCFYQQTMKTPKLAVCKLSWQANMQRPHSLYWNGLVQHCSYFIHTLVRCADMRRCSAVAMLTRRCWFSHFTQRKRKIFNFGLKLNILRLRWVNCENLFSIVYLPIRRHFF